MRSEPSGAPSRRTFTKQLAGAAATTLLPRSLWARIHAGLVAEEAFRWEAIAPVARVAFGMGGNALVVVAKGGRDALLIDTKVAGFGQVLDREATAAGARIRTVINTHHHNDHTGGNDAFTRTATTVAHARARTRVLADVGSSLARLKGAPVDAYADGLRKSGFDVRVTPEARRDVERFIAGLDGATPEAFAPAETFDTERELRAAGYVVQVKHVTPGHTDNDVIVFLPELNILHAGDLLFNAHHTFVDASAGGTTVGWGRSLAAAMAMCTPATRVVAGHGPVTDRAGLQRQRDYFDRLRDAAGTAIREGRTRAEVTALTPAGLGDLGWPELLADTLGVIYDELSHGK